ncbi:A [Escherichia phage G4]|uniref:A n=2 Tax=Escherichia phage G4 TaxID=10843 RepID=D0U1B5_BPG4|nr:A [Escherichia phage G4] [Escherichia phage G4]
MFKVHSDYFNKPNIDAIKPLVETAGMSVLTQSPNLRIWKQCNTRIKLLEEILAHYTNGIRRDDNGDFWMNPNSQLVTTIAYRAHHRGHNPKFKQYPETFTLDDIITGKPIPQTAPDELQLSDEIGEDYRLTVLSIIEELQECYDVLGQLDINNTIDHKPLGNDHWNLLYEKPVYKHWYQLVSNRPLKDIRADYNYAKAKGVKDECSKILEESTMKSRRGFIVQRLMNAMRTAHSQGWYVVFDTLTLADDRLKDFYDNPNALRDYFRDIGRMVLTAEGRSVHDSSSDCYQYFCVPEYGTQHGRLHFHAVHLIRTLPLGSLDPNFGKLVRTNRQINSLQNTWPYGYSMPIAVRYSQDAFSRAGWLWPVDSKGEPLKATSYMAVGFYVAKYVNKKSDIDMAVKGLGNKEWNNSLKTKINLIPKKVFRIRMSRNFGMKLLSMAHLSAETLMELTQVGYDVTPFNNILRQNAKKELKSRLAKKSVADVLEAQPVTTNLLKFMRNLTRTIGASNLQSFIASMTTKLTSTDISDETKNYVASAGIAVANLRIKSKWTAGGK